MRFFVPEWDDAVDAEYDFIHDELSNLDKNERERDFIWDIFENEDVPIDGVLISREQVGSNSKKSSRLLNYGVYEDPELSVPYWLPTISDCGAWGYKSLPFPPYQLQEMLEFYESLEVDIGVSIDHLVLGSGKTRGRLYLDERAFSSEFTVKDLPDELSNEVDVMVESWPDEWPASVTNYEPSIVTQQSPLSFDASEFTGSVSTVIENLENDPRAVYRKDDRQFRYELTLDNARKMQSIYEKGEWSFRLMGAFQGWDPQSYRKAALEVIDMGYDYIGIGGVAGSSVKSIEEIVSEVGAVIANHHRENCTRIDSHIFGFAKSSAFPTIGKSGISSFDSASMLRAAWTGGQNYHISPNERYDAIRVRYPQSSDSLEISIEKALRGQEVLRSLRAYERNESISAAIEDWYMETDTALNSFAEYLKENRFSNRYQKSSIRDIRSEFRDDYRFSLPLISSFGKQFIRRILGLLREDNSTDPVDFNKYQSLIETAQDVFEPFPRLYDDIYGLEDESNIGTFNQISYVVEEYATSELFNDEFLLDEYRRTLRSRPWEKCNCSICEDIGIEVAVFRGNNRNRRRGFHNTRRFYNEFEREIPKILVSLPVTSDVIKYDKVENFLRREYPLFWESVFDLPIVEIGIFGANGFYEWHEPAPNRVSLDPAGINTSLEEYTLRYNTIYMYDRSLEVTLDSNIESVVYSNDPEEIRSSVLSQLDYGEDYAPTSKIQVDLGEFE